MFAGATLIWICLPRPSLLDGVQFSQRVFDREGKLLRITLTEDEKFRVFTPLAEISPDLIHATLAREDRFYDAHFGVNPFAVMRTVAKHCFTSDARGGASTITMQLARLRFGLRTRTLRGKLAQMGRALELERHYTKRQILEAYFNLAPYGGNVEGIGAASEIYFGKAPAHLTAPEAIALSVIPQSPARRAPLPARENSALAAAQHRVLADQAEPFAISAPRHRTFGAPHFVTLVLGENPQEPQLVTTLDLDLQRLVERRLENYVAANRRLGINNAAAMLVDARSMEVLAQVGSADFADAKISGQIDGTRVRRSPGSTLKPFVYALALDQGLIHPLTLLKDTSRSFGEYQPENFDREFAGPIHAEDALVRSRNLPAIALAEQLAHPTLYEFLQSAEVKLARDEKSIGLTLPLGGAEVTMQDLVRLYCTLANEGRAQPLRRLLAPGQPHRAARSDPHLHLHIHLHSGLRIAGREGASESAGASGNDRGVRVLSPEAAYLTLEMLAKNPNPSTNDSRSDGFTAWKTGTSNGFHDAWAIGVIDHFVLAVWLGNFDGTANPALIGRSMAAPLFFGIADALRARGNAAPERHDPPANANLRRVEFCAVSGQLPTAACAHRVSGWFIPGRSPITTCEIHREVLVDAKTALRVAHAERGREVRRETYEFWPSDLLDLFAKAGLPRRQPPPFLPGEELEASARIGRAPRIVSPASHLAYTLRANDSVAHRLALRAETEADVSKLYWFADKNFLGAANAHDSLEWTLQAGRHTITALDDCGRSDSRVVEVISTALDERF